MFWMTLREMARVVRLGGYVYVNAPSTGPYHAFPGDNWRFYRDAPAALALWCGKAYGSELPAYPLQVVSQRFNGAKIFNDNVMVWRRSSRPATWLTVQAPPTPAAPRHRPGGEGGSGPGRDERGRSHPRLAAARHRSLWDDGRAPL